MGSHVCAASRGLGCIFLFAFAIGGLMQPIPMPFDPGSPESLQIVDATWGLDQERTKALPAAYQELLAAYHAGNKSSVLNTNSDGTCVVIVRSSPSLNAQSAD